MVFYNTKYLNKATALEMYDGIVILATLYEVRIAIHFLRRFQRLQVLT